MNTVTIGQASAAMFQSGISYTHIAQVIDILLASNVQAPKVKNNVADMRVSARKLTCKKAILEAFKVKNTTRLSSKELRETAVRLGNGKFREKTVSITLSQHMRGIVKNDTYGVWSLV